MRTSVALRSFFATLSSAAPSRRSSLSLLGPLPSLSLLRRALPSPLPLFSSPSSPCRLLAMSIPSEAESAIAHASLEKQFSEFSDRLNESSRVRDRIREVVAEMEIVIRAMQSNVLLLHQSHSIQDTLEKSNSSIAQLNLLFARLVDILRECPGQYYRYNGDWRSETQTVISILAFLHWMKTGNLLLHNDVEELLGLNTAEFGLDIEDYLIGLCFMSNELPRYVVNRVTAGDYDCPRKVLEFLTELHSSFRMLNLRNDFLRKKFDGMKYDLRRVEEVHYDVKIRGLTGSTAI
ncbi:translin family protein [Wolffia australiana]